MSTIRLGMAQYNFTVGDIEGNKNKIIEIIKLGSKKNIQVLAFPELALTGYPPEDLLLKSAFLRRTTEAVKEISAAVGDMLVIVGAPHVTDDVYNAAYFMHRGEVAGVYHKIYLPNYGVFDENRYFQSGNAINVIQLNDMKIGVNVCEDIWYPKGPTFYQALHGDAELIINISSSPYHVGKSKDRIRMISTRAEDNAVVVAYVNLVGGQDELVFDGNSAVVSEEGKVLAKAPAFKEALLIADIKRERVFSKRLHDPRRRKLKMTDTSEIYPIDFIKVGNISNSLSDKIKPEITDLEIREEQEVLLALETGLKDYVMKNGFGKVVIGLSGGIDSALVACIAVRALGSENVTCVFMPSKYTSKASHEDAKQLADNLGVEYHIVPIDDLFQQYKTLLSPYFKGKQEDITEENIQARIRGNLLMAFSNKFGYLVLSTGNKSEISVGYSTLYGDMVGGFSVIKDVPKTMVYKLSTYINDINKKEVIPERIITRPPSAELKENQTDQDTLPPYDILDQIIQYYVEEDWDTEKIIESGFDPDMVKKIVKMVNANEYKRRQSAPGIKITPRSFGKDRRVPITNRFNEFNGEQ